MIIKYKIFNYILLNIFYSDYPKLRIGDWAQSPYKIKFNKFLNNYFNKLI